jgi:hypothetical protein
MPVSLTDPNSDAAGDFRDDHWFVAGIQRTGKCRHSQERNEKKGKHSILHGILLEWDARRPDARQNTRLVFLKSYRIDQCCSRAAVEILHGFLEYRWHPLCRSGQRLLRSTQIDSNS